MGYGKQYNKSGSILRRFTVDLLDTTKDGFVDTSLVLPNGTLGVGDEYTAFTIILEDVCLTCSTGFNPPTNRAEFVEVIAPSSKGE